MGRCPEAFNAVANEPAVLAHRSVTALAIVACCDKSFAPIADCAVAAIESFVEALDARREKELAS